jgi:protein arginine kinase
MADKWYNDSLMDVGAIVSSRVRLARNIGKYAFMLTQDSVGANAVINDVSDALKRGGDGFFGRFGYTDMTRCSDVEKLALLNRHAISPEFLKTKGPAGLWLEENESLSIMINEEDHIRLQAIYPGDNMDKAWDLIDKTDDLLEESIDYAYDGNFGYLTSCPTNTGTGLRASYMLHLPLLEATGEFRNIAAAIGKFGMTARGIYGEGTAPMGGIYQISNQVSIGKSEEEIIASLKAITSQIIESEKGLREKMSVQARIEAEDKAYRAYGILCNCRKICLKEAISLLSDARFGYTSGILTEKRPKLNIYAMMMNVQNGLMQYNMGRALDESEGDVARAAYLRGMFE